MIACCDFVGSHRNNADWVRQTESGKCDSTEFYLALYLGCMLPKAVDSTSDLVTLNTDMEMRILYKVRQT